MNRPWGLIYSLSGLIVLLGLAIVFVGRLNSVREVNIAESDASYSQLTRSLSDEPDLFSIGEVLDRYFGRVSNVDSVALYFPHRGMVFLRVRDSDVLSISATQLSEFSGFPTYHAGEISWMTRRSELSDSVFSDLYLDVVFRIVSFEDIYPLLRDTLIALLLFALLLAGLALTQGREKAHRHTNLSRNEPSSVNETTSASTPLVVPETHEAGRESHYHPDLDTELEVEEVPADESEPGTLFDPVTGLSFEAHLNRKLGLELERAASPDAIGLSARNGRLVEAARVLKEAARSLEHARSHPSRVVGFRPDPKKYRQFVSEHTS